ncbi:CPBP family intramembrane glutamic endopeptidase [Clostridium omnivorum]|uniref:CAAX prenyl protease 2/Lysostaphin resistance protein A-like domain-containing protein n=1 Tax=Clostridium omnivorum TaxID=1604902 RepID=A0ABQ5N4S3_9CLOT|nr:type II CAAX endopeptidase family protein [Clostridium sp. E14]GLC30217.1 hypothetical protein bsdE14_16270 [Clostridium sp. E14]
MTKISKTDLIFLSYDLVFILIGYMCLYFYSKHNASAFNPLPITLAIIISILLIHIIPINKNKDTHIYRNKKALFPFIIAYSMLILLIIALNTLFNLNNSSVRNFNQTYILLIQLGLTAAIFSCYLFKIKLSDFNWNISSKTFAYIVLIFIIYRFIINFNGIVDGTINIKGILNLEFIIDFALKATINSLYPALFEEVAFRGFLISGLKGFNLNNNACNIIQSLIFGSAHIASWGMPTSLIQLLVLAIQVMIGYLLGKIYFKTDSLLPCILFHGLYNTI